MKRSLAAIASSPVLQPVFSRLLRGRAVIYMLHRFREQHGHHHHDPALLRQCLALLRRHRVPIRSLTDAVRRLEEGRPLDGVIFTIDDGYFDFASVAAPIFREFDCPATVFVATGFIDGFYWFWWDKLTLALNQTDTTSLRLDGVSEPLPLTTVEQRALANARLVEWVRSLPQERRQAALDDVFAQLHVVVPATAAPAYRPLTWDAIRALAAEGFEFAPHTINHTSVGSMSAAAMRAEISGSARRLAEERIDYVPVFAYPYGQRVDVSEQAADVVREEGLAAAVTALPGYAAPASVRDRYLIPRFAFPQELVDIRQVVFGFERLKEIIYEWRAS